MSNGLHNGDSISLTVSGLNPHTHLAISGNAHYFNSSNFDFPSTLHAGQFDFTTKVDGQTVDDQNIHLQPGDGYYYDSFDFGFGTDIPLKHRDSSATITFTANDLPTGDSVSMAWLHVAAMRPTVDISTIKGSAVEADDPTLTFRVSREPGVPMDDALQVDLGSPTGTATEGVDYGNLPTSVTIDAGSDHVDFGTGAIDDMKAEGLETLNLGFYTGGRGPFNPLYNINPAAFAAAMIDDNVKVSSIKVILTENPTFENNNYRYDFFVDIKVGGEHLDQVLLAQDIFARSSMIDYTGKHVLTPNEIRQWYNSHGGGEDVAYTVGNNPILDWDNIGLLGSPFWSEPILPITAKSSFGYASDEQAGKMPADWDNTRQHPPLAHYSYIGSITRTLNTRAGYINHLGQYQLLMQKNWGSTWDNSNTKWRADQDPPPPVTSCTNARNGAANLILFGIDS